MKEKKITLQYTHMMAISIFVAVFLIEMVAIGYGSFVHERIYRDRVVNDLLMVATLNTEHAEILLREQKKKISIFSKSRFLEKALEEVNQKTETPETLAGIKHELSSIYDEDKDFEVIYVTDANGTIVTATDSNFEGSAAPGIISFIEGTEDSRLSSVYYSNLLKSNVVDFASKIYNDKSEVLLGTLIGILSVDLLAEIVKVDGLGETGESFVVDSGGLLLTPSKFLGGENRGVLTQQIDTANFGECFMQKAGGIDTHSVSESYLDYRGEEVFGTHAPIPASEWCLITKIDKEEIVKVSRNSFLAKNVVAALIFPLLILFVWFIVSRFREKRKQ